MATTTTNLGLTKPTDAESLNIAVINANMDSLDSAVSGKISRSQGLTTTTDLNTIKTTGIYYGYNWVNGAAANISTLIVINYSPDWVTQILHNLNGNGLYVRRYHSGTTWTDWEKISTQDDIVSVTSGTKKLHQIPRRHDDSY